MGEVIEMSAYRERAPLAFEPERPYAEVGGAYCLGNGSVEHERDYAAEELNAELVAEQIKEHAGRVESLFARMAFIDAATAYQVQRTVLGSGAGFDAEHYAYAGQCAAADHINALFEQHTGVGDQYQGEAPADVSASAAAMMFPTGGEAA